MNLEKAAEVVEIDLPVIYAYIAKSDVAAADRVLEAIEATFSGLAQSPLSGVISRFKPITAAHLRMIPVDDFPKYLVFYSTGTDFVRILYVVHSARDLPALFAVDRRE